MSFFRSSTWLSALPSPVAGPTITFTSLSGTFSHTNISVVALCPNERFCSVLFSSCVDPDGGNFRPRAAAGAMEGPSGIMLQSRHSVGVLEPFHVLHHMGQDYYCSNPRVQSYRRHRERPSRPLSPSGGGSWASGVAE